VIDLARKEPVEVSARIIADAIRTGAVSEARVAEQLAAARGHDGFPQAEAAFALADPALESVIEGELFELLTAAGLIVVPQFEVVQSGVFIARLDFAIEGLRLGYEADGYGVHSLRPAFVRPRATSAPATRGLDDPVVHRDTDSAAPELGSRRRSAHGAQAAAGIRKSS